VMNLFITGVTEAQEALKSLGQKAREQAQKASDGEESKDSTQKVADAVARVATGEHLSLEGKQKGGPIVHYAFGTLMGAVYGGLAQPSDAASAGAGSAFGTALFIGEDEIVVPALGLGKLPTEEPVSSQAIHLAAHIVYGAATDLVRRTIV
jgi:putative membrane protein